MEFRAVQSYQASSHKRIIMFAVVAVVAALFGVVVLIWSKGDNKGTVVNVPDTTHQHGPAVKELVGTYISFQYAGGYDLKKSALGDTDLEAYMLTAGTNYEKHIAVDVALPENGKLDNFTPYIARKTRADLYQQQSITVAGEPAVLFIKNDLTERTVLIPHNSSITTLSFVSKGSTDDLQTEINQLLATFKWRD